MERYLSTWRQTQEVRNDARNTTLSMFKSWCERREADDV